MNSLLSNALELQHVAHELTYLGMNGDPIYSDTFCRLNKEVLDRADSLYLSRSSDAEEEANLCLALLMGYNATIYNYGDKEQKKQTVLERAFAVLKQLPSSLLKVRLLASCYGETYEEGLLQLAYSIIGQWDENALSAEQSEVMAELKNMEENPYPFEVLD